MKDIFLYAQTIIEFFLHDCHIDGEGTNWEKTFHLNNFE